jgi:anti-sigma factor RsiW
MSGLLHRIGFRWDHRWAPGHMSYYLDGELASNAHGRMERHLGECGECRRLLAGLRATVAALHRMPPPAGGVDGPALAAAVSVRLD